MLLLASTRCFLLTACVVRRTGCTLYGLLSRLAHWTTAVRRAATFWCVAGGCQVTTVTTHHHHHRQTPGVGTVCTGVSLLWSKRSPPQNRWIFMPLCTVVQIQNRMCHVGGEVI